MTGGEFLRPPIELTRPQPASSIPAQNAMPGGCHYQLKLDGFRAAGFALPDGPVLQSRAGRDLAPRFPELTDAIAALPPGTVLDGEIVAWRGNRFSFTDLLSTPAARRRDRVEVRFVAFDLLALPEGRRGARDIRDLTLEARWAYLEGLLTAVRPPIELVMATRDRAEAVAWFDALLPIGVEGLVVKPLASAYEGARWLKVKHTDTVDGEAVAVLGDPRRPRALRVRLPDGRVADTSPALNAVQAAQIAAAGSPPFPVEVRVIAGRHVVVRFVRVRGD
jgi:ATP-dependent DNA ligase